MAYIHGEGGPDVELVDRALSDYSLVLSPVTVTELLSGPLVTPSLENFILGILRLEIKPGYWERAGKLRADLIRRGYRPKIADTLIAQSCLDHDVPLDYPGPGFLVLSEVRRPAPSGDGRSAAITKQPPLPLLTKEGNLPTNSPPRLSRGPGGGGPARWLYFLRGGCEGRISMRLARVVEGYV